MDNIPNKCPLEIHLLTNIASICKRTDRCPDSVRNAIKNLHKNPFQNHILNRIWKLILIFLIWGIWKERNLGSFEGKLNSLETIWIQCQQHIRETTLLSSWKEKYLQSHL